ISVLAGHDGDVLVDGGHGQFGAQHALSAEDVAFYQRFLEGVGIGIEGINTLDGGLLDRGRALIITTPTRAHDPSTLDAVRSFRDDGGAVILMGSDDASADGRADLNDVASELGTDLRLSETSVTDSSANLNDDPSLVTTSNLNQRFGLFGAFSPGQAALTTTTSTSTTVQTTTSAGTTTSTQTTTS
ncbi:MAG: hypothetical protein ABEI52_12505, partial [Halobacteriaceae archaeon]